MGYEGIERRAQERIDRSFETRPVIISAHEKAMKAFEADTIHPEDFKDLYGEEVIARDLARVESIRAKFAPEDRAKYAAEIMEGILCDQAERSDWLGPHAQTIKTSEYDDFINGVDLVVEFDEPEQARKHLALGVDATFGTRTIEKKFTRIKEEIDAGQLASIKYFRSQNGSFMGRLSRVPRVVTGIDQEHLLDLAAIWNQGENRALAVHPVQRLVLAQIAQQLRTFGDYAERTGKHELVRPFREALTTVREVSQKKTSIDVSSVRDDKVHREITGHLEMFK